MRVRDEESLAPLRSTGKLFYFLGAVLLAVVAWFVVGYISQLREGLAVTGLGNLGVPIAGAPWGVYIVNFFWFVGTAHACVSIAAIIHLLKLDNYRSIIRMAELLGVVTMMMAGLSILIDLGRPERVLNMLLYYPQRVTQSPLVWDFTIITIFFLLSSTYLYLSMRKDLVVIRDKFPNRLRGLYNLLLVGYRPEEEAKVDRATKWLAVTHLTISIMAAGGAIPWLFALTQAQAGWFSAVLGPSSLISSFASAIASLIIITAVLRKVFGWQERLKTEVFRGLGIVLAVVILFKLYFILNEQLIANAAPLAEAAVSQKLLTGSFAPVFWSTLVIGFVLPLAYLLLQTANSKLFKIGWVVFSAVLVAIGVWLWRFLFVVPSLLSPGLPYSEGIYSPTWVEWSVVAGTIAIACLLFMVFIKLFPIVEMRSSSNE